MTELTSNSVQIEEIFLARPLTTPIMFAILIALILLSVYLYRRSWGLRPWQRVLLGVVRVVALALVCITLLEPMAVVRKTNTQQRGLPVLVDISESMAMKDQRKSNEDLVEAAAALDLLADTESDAAQAALGLGVKQRQAIATSSRLDLATNLLSRSARSTLALLDEHVDVSYHTFGKTSRMLTDDGVMTEKVASELQPIETETAIAKALESVANSGGVPPAGIVLLSDGIDNAGSLHTKSILRDLGTRGIPVYTIPIGLAEPDDISIRNIVMQEVAYSGDRVPVRIQLQSKGYEKRTARMSVMLNGRRVSQRTVQFDGGLQFQDIDFRVDVYEKGAAQIEVVVDPFDDEVSSDNNRIERSIRIVNEKVNVLYIEGNARWEYRYLRAILKRDPRINATFIASNAGPEVARNSTEHIERFPNQREEAFQYDLIILGDVDAAFFNDDELRMLNELVRDRGASLLMLCGAMHSPSSYSGTPVETMLPIRFDPDSPWEEVAEAVYPVLTPAGSSSLVMTLENDPAANDRIWSRVSPLDHLPPLLEAKPGATVLATLSDSGSRAQQFPLVAWQRYGTGKCMSIATDRLWRLRFKTGDKYHWRLWSQCIQFMTLSRLMGEHKRIRLETDRAIYPVGSQCRVYAHVLDDDFEPVIQPRFDVIVSGLGEDNSVETVSLRPDRSHPGLYEGYFTPPSPGRYRIESNENDQPISNTTEFQVAVVKKELTDPNVRIEQMKRIADLTGGVCLNMDEFSKIESLVDNDPVTTTVRSERPLWDNGWMAFVLVGLVGLEWILRRRNDLP
ncbi:MAG: hypothetical protein OSB68_10035 [Dehalococcoidia bacterium]|nr:hypothetical protein [Dehalococcoidia bacterium]